MGGKETEMIVFRMAGLNIGIDNRYIRGDRFEGFFTDNPPDFTVSVTEEELAAELPVSPVKNKDYLEYICAYRKIAELLPDYDAFVLHGAVITRAGGSFVFTAPSGTGKTTHILLWKSEFPDCWVLSGDKPIIRRYKGEFYACGTPWLGKEGMGSRSIRPLTAVTILNRGAENEIRPATREEIVQTLLRQLYRPKDPARLAKQLALVNDCFRVTPIYTMHCNMDPSAAHTAWDAMRVHLPPENGR